MTISDLSRRVCVAVLGAGYAGLTAFLELEGRLHRQDFDLVLVNATPYHYFVTQLHTLAACVQEEEGLRLPLRRVVRPPGRLLVARIAALDPGRRRVELADRPALTYDYAVVGLGSDPETFDIPGVADHALVIGTPQEARRFRARLRAVLATAGDRRPRVVIAGGGLTGVELAGELADTYHQRLEMTLVEAGPVLMPGCDALLADVARRVLADKGVAVRTGTPIVRATEGEVHLGDGGAVAYDLFIWAAGVRGNALLAGTGLDLTPRGRVKVDPQLRALGFPTLYVTGDAAALVDPATGRELPPSAQLAVQMGRHAAGNLLRRLQGQAEEPFVPRQRGFLASLGRDTGVGAIGGEPLLGLPALLAKRLLEAHHAYEAGGVVPIVQRLFRPAARLLDGRARVRRRPAAGTPAAGGPAAGPGAVDGDGMCRTWANERG